MERKETRQKGRVTQTIGTFALGATLGSIVALLCAPVSGRTTRSRLKLQFRNWQRSAVQLRDKAAKQINYAREWVTGHATNGHGRRVARRQMAHHA